MMTDNPHLHLDTLAVHTAMEPSQYGENSEALYLTSGYVQPDAATAARRFAGEEEGYTYGRLGNPTVSSMEMRLAAMEGTEAALATSTGMSAILLMASPALAACDPVDGEPPAGPQLSMASGLVLRACAVPGTGTRHLL